MRRREFIAGLGSAAAWPAVARPQQPERMRRVGYLTFGAESDGPFAKALRDELRKVGWIEGRNLRLDFRFGASDVNRTRADAAELVKLAPDVIVTVGGPATRAMQEQTQTIPIVTSGGDILANGIVKNVARPEGNITGFMNAFSALGSKWLELLKEAAPNITRVANVFPLVNSNNSYRLPIAASAQSLGLQLVTIPVSDVAGMRAAIEAFAAGPTEAWSLIQGCSRSRRSN
jgi:putative ABC transport system substrate-binding protein